jgi:hypothetical protein
MWIRVAAFAPSNFEMRLSLVALSAYWNNLADCRGVTSMAVLTANPGLVLAAISLYIVRCLTMAMDADVAGQSAVLFILRSSRRFL